MLSMLEEEMPTLRILILGGEACRPDLVKRWCRPGLRMFNTYGPTEATVIATWAECRPEAPVTIGRPLPNYYVYILDEEKRRVSPGSPGELYIGGAGVARGYVGRPDLTSERFILNPFETAPFAPRLYKTGDLVRFTARGEIEFLGRTDTQVKIRGFRVELSEIENALGVRPEVTASVVTVREVHGMQQLVAYVVPRAKTDFDETLI
jgi:non-ribosomal peptide synthetase component F